MLPAGEITQQTIDKLAKLLDRDDTIVDGGNTKWTDDKRAPRQLKKSGIHYVDVGTSGRRVGPGGRLLHDGRRPDQGGEAPRADPRRAGAARPTSRAVAAIGPRGWQHFGPAGAGHFVKMVHNGVEYGLMQAYAEGFDLFDKCEYELDNAKIAHLWGQGSVVRSWLCELAARAFEADGNDLHTLDRLHRGLRRGRWTIAEATARDVPTPVITASLYARLYSRGNGDYAHRVLAALRNQFGGHAVQEARAQAKPAANGAGNCRTRAATRGRGGPRPASRARADAAWTGRQPMSDRRQPRGPRTRSSRAWSACRCARPRS